MFLMFILLASKDTHFSKLMSRVFHFNRNIFVPNFRIETYLKELLKILDKHI